MQKNEVFKLALQYQDALAAYAYSLLRDWSLAEDAVQDTLVLLMSKWEQYNPEQNIFFWMKKMVYFKSLELLKKRSKIQESCSLEFEVKEIFEAPYLTD